MRFKVMGLCMMLLLLLPVLAQDTPVVTVDDDAVDTEAFQDRLFFETILLDLELNDVFSTAATQGIDPELYLSRDPYATYVAETQDPQLLAERVLEMLVQELLLEDFADEHDLSITDEAIQQTLRLFFAPSDPDALTPAMLSERTDTYYEHMTTEYNTTPQQLDSYFWRLTLRRLVKDHVTADVPGTGMYVNSRHILVETEAEAESILTQLEAGTSFEMLAQTYSLDAGTARNGGDLDWFAVDEFVTPYAEAVSTLPLNTLSEPVETDFGFHIIEVLEREMRLYTEDELALRQNQFYEAWLVDYTDEHADSITIADDWRDYVVYSDGNQQQGLSAVLDLLSGDATATPQP